MREIFGVRGIRMNRATVASCDPAGDERNLYDLRACLCSFGLKSISQHVVLKPDVDVFSMPCRDGFHLWLLSR